MVSTLVGLLKALRRKYSVNPRCWGYGTLRESCSTHDDALISVSFEGAVANGKFPWNTQGERD